MRLLSSVTVSQNQGCYDTVHFGWGRKDYYNIRENMNPEELEHLVEGMKTKHCPDCGSARPLSVQTQSNWFITGEVTVSFDVYCDTCGWSGDVYPDALDRLSMSKEDWIEWATEETGKSCMICQELAKSNKTSQGATQFPPITQNPR
jgi:hypothetical protein